MNLQEILTKIEKEEITVIQEEVKVQFDNSQQTPLGFQWRGKHYEVFERLLAFKCPGGHLYYLVLTNGGVFCLALVREREDLPLCRSRWVLRYKVKLEDGKAGIFTQEVPASAKVAQPSLPAEPALPIGASRQVMVPLPLANIVRYHGHLCPELAIGYRVGVIAQRELGISREKAHSFFALAENMTSAIDALQFMTGCTVGNQNFFAYDLGKHVYYFGPAQNGNELQEVLRVALINPVVDFAGKGEIEKKILAGQAEPAELENYQRALDEAVEQILTLPEEKLFTKSRVFMRIPVKENCCRYTRCSRCGEVVAVEKTIAGENELLCRVCAARAI